MMNRIIIILAISLSLISCQPEGRVFIEHKKLSPDTEWLKKDTREFKVPVKSLEKTYTMSLSFRYATGYEFQLAKVKVTETSPSGKKSIMEYDLKTREDDGNYIGEAGYDIWDNEHIIDAQKKYSEIGTYTYLIEQNMSVDPLNFAMEIGVILDEQK